jgi:hypothetical protein
MFLKIRRFKMKKGIRKGIIKGIEKKIKRLSKKEKRLNEKKLKLISKINFIEIKKINLKNELDVEKMKERV